MKLHEFQQKLAVEKAMKVAKASIAAGASKENALKAAERSLDESFKARERSAKIAEVKRRTGWTEEAATAYVDDALGWAKRS
jgi:hypothetical protein